tara:strand:+ start:1019 stop:1597 length:579 start_codon:yes stop_codon:yes gene_type:complete
MITQSRLKKVLEYDSESGVFIWKVSHKRIRAGKVAGNVHKNTGYVQITIDAIWHSAHRLAFLYMTGAFPEKYTDHINGVRHDNRWRNLRPVTSSENSRNKVMSKNNTSGITGVSWEKKAGKWRSLIYFDGQQQFLGYFDHLFEAAAARRSAELKHDYHPNHGRIAFGSRENRRPISNRANLTARIGIKRIPG